VEKTQVCLCLSCTISGLRRHSLTNSSHVVPHHAEVYCLQKVWHNAFTNYSLNSRHILILNGKCICEIEQHQTGNILIKWTKWAYFLFIFYNLFVKTARTPLVFPILPRTKACSLKWSSDAHMPWEAITRHAILYLKDELLNAFRICWTPNLLNSIMLAKNSEQNWKHIIALTYHMKGEYTSGVD